ncbi:MAG: calcium-binding protein [Asticcacaulis sp.]
MTLTDSAIIGTGNVLDNSIVGTAGNNFLYGGGGNDLLNGGAGADHMFGGAGDDTYLVDDSGDRVSEQTVAGVDDGGKDTVQSYVGFHLGAGFENLTLLGGAALNGTGNELANIIVGNTNDNVINGGAGADTMSGGKGNDTYFVDDANDLVIENAGEGTKDKVISSVAYTLTANVENLTVTGTGDFTVKGNDLANIVVANAGNNLVDGGAGGDHMFGGAGNDTYIVDNDGDRISEQLTGSADDGGTDLVMSSVTWHLFAFVENLTLTGTADTNATGNNLNNILIGNSGNNVLNGLTGADTMSGGAGNDGYIVDNVNDVVIENANEGTDKVLASVSYTLSANVENLALQGTGNINGTGNALANTIVGNSGNNALDGKGGADVMLGGAGNDTYVVDIPATGSRSRRSPTMTTAASISSRPASASRSAASSKT